jgi:hypothetical protein
VTLGAIHGGVLLKGGGIGAKGGPAQSAAFDVGVDVASALVLESFLRDSSRGSALAAPGNPQGAVVTHGTITFVMDEGTSPIGSGPSTTGILDAAAVDTILADGDGERVATRDAPERP